MIREWEIHVIVKHPKLTKERRIRTFGLPPLPQKGDAFIVRGEIMASFEVNESFHVISAVEVLELQHSYNSDIQAGTRLWEIVVVPAAKVDTKREDPLPRRSKATK